MFTALKKYEPAGYTQFLTHTITWITSSTNDYIFKNPAHIQSPDSIAVYCTHGTADRPKAFIKIAERLIQKGLSPKISSIHLVSFNKRFQGNSIENFSVQLLNKIKQNKHNNVILIGHSRGGLVNAFMAETLAIDNDINVENVINLATPFYGSFWASAPLTFVSKSVEMMTIDNNWLATLRNKINLSESKYHFVTAPKDSLVNAESTYVAEYVEKNKEAQITLSTSHGHVSMLSSHVLTDYIHSILNVKDTNQNLPKIEESVSDCSEDFESEDDVTYTLF